MKLLEKMKSKTDGKVTKKLDNVEEEVIDEDNDIMNY